MTATAKTTMPKGCQFDHRLSFRRLPLGAFGKQDQDYDHDVFNSAGYTLARPHFGLENGVHLTRPAISLNRAPQLPSACRGNVLYIRPRFINEGRES